MATLPETVDLVELGPEFVRDPYPVYEQLRARGPVHRVRVEQGDIWLVVGHEACRAAYTHPGLSRDWRKSTDAFELRRAQGEHPTMAAMLHRDPPDHTRLRRLVSKAFTPRRVAAFEPRVRELTDQLIDGFAARGEADLIHEFAFPLPLYAICDLLGVPAQDQDDFRQWAGMMLRHPAAGSAGGRAATPRGGVGRAVKRMRSYLAELIHRKRATLHESPDDDLIAGLIRASDHGEQLTENEVAAMAFILLFAGFETTVNLIGNGTYTLLRHPAQRAQLQQAVAEGDQGALADAVEELLRYDGPVELATWRFATQPLELAGQRIETGDPVLVVLAAADRDPERFPHPDLLQLRRGDNQHVGYGHGMHYCLGAPLARLEGQVAIGTLLHRLGDLQLAAEPDELGWRGGLIMRGLRELPVRFTAAADGQQPTT